MGRVGGEGRKRGDEEIGGKFDFFFLVEKVDQPTRFYLI